MNALDQKRNAQAIKAMCTTDGWIILEQELTSELNSLNNKLIMSDNEAETTNLKYEVRGLKKLFDKVLFYTHIK